MTGRNLNATFAAAMQAAHVDGFVLVEMYLDSGTLYVSGLPFPFDWAGNTYLPVMGLGTVRELVETDSEVQGLQFTMSGVPESAISLVAAEEVQGRKVTVRQAIIEAGTVYMDDSVWEGTLDVMTLEDSGPTATVTVSAEHALASWAEPRQLLYSHEDQQLISPGDKFFEYAAQMSNATLTWPGKEFDQV